MLSISPELVLWATTNVLSATTLAASHWFPWHNGTQMLRRTTAYAIGTSVVVGYPVAAMLLCAGWGLSMGELFWALLLLCNVAVSGATVLIAYWIDSHRALTGNEVRHAGQGR